MYNVLWCLFVYSCFFALEINADFKCYSKVLVRVVHWLFPDFAFMWLVEEAKKNMPLELDFLNEGHNAEKVAKMLAHLSFLKVHVKQTEA